jgi:hypothetical protein
MQSVAPPNAKQQPIQSSERLRHPVLTSKNLSIVVTGAILIVALLKADSKDVPEIVKTVVSSNTMAIVGWTLAIVLLIGSVVFIRLLIKFYDQEMKRIARERDYLQAILIERKGN